MEYEDKIIGRNSGIIEVEAAISDPELSGMLNTQFAVHPTKLKQMRDLGINYFIALHSDYPDYPPIREAAEKIAFENGKFVCLTHGAGASLTYLNIEQKAESNLPNQQ